MNREISAERVERIVHQFHRYQSYFGKRGVDRRQFLQLIAKGSAAATVFPALQTGGVLGVEEVAAARVDAGPQSRTFMVQDGGEPVTGGTILIATLGEASSINPLTVNDTEGTWRCKMLYDQFIELDLETLEPGPAIAKSWTVSDDGTVYTFLMDENVTFSDGTPLTAQDIEFTISAFSTQTVASPAVDNFTAIVGAQEFYDSSADSISGVDVIDEYTIEITLAEPNASWVSKLQTLKPLPKHLLDGKDLVNDEFFQAPVGAGPYMFQSWSTGQDFVAERNPHYYREDQPYLDSFTHRVIPDSQTLVISVQTSEVDGSEFVLPTQAEQVRALGNYIVESKPPGYDTNGWNFGHNNNEFLSDVRVRRAIAMAIDTEIFASDFLLGLGTVATGPIPSGNWAYNDNVSPLPYDPEQAMALLEEAGATGIKLRATTNAGNQFREDWVTYTQQSLEQVGITVEPDIKEWALVVQDGTKGTFELICPTFAGVIVDPDELYSRLHSGEPQNVSGYSNPDADALLEEGRTTVDQEERTRIYGELQELLVEDVAVLWAWDRPFISVIRDDFVGHQPTLLAFFNSLPSWYRTSGEG